jgi:hypothetical protein
MEGEDDWYDGLPLAAAGIVLGVCALIALSFWIFT